MPNWCSAVYAIEGNANEVKKLYELMKELQERKEPSVENGFGTTWLGCLVDALGGDWNKICCRGEWSNLEMGNSVLKFATETAWSPCNETFDLVCKKFQSLRYYYQSEELGMAEYRTNDREGKYFPDKYVLDLCMPDKKYIYEYFTDFANLLKFFEEISGQPVKSEQDIKMVVEQWKVKNEDAFCYVNKFVVSD